MNKQIVFCDFYLKLNMVYKTMSLNYWSCPQVVSSIWLITSVFEIIGAAYKARLWTPSASSKFRMYLLIANILLRLYHFSPKPNFKTNPLMLLNPNITQAFCSLQETAS